MQQRCHRHYFNSPGPEHCAIADKKDGNSLRKEGSMDTGIITQPKISKKQEFADLLEAAKPLMKLLAERYHPHMTAHVDSGRVELLEGYMNIPHGEFIKD